jgi:hypothetical protein
MILLVLLVPVMIGAFMLAMERLEHELLDTIDAVDDAPSAPGLPRQRVVVSLRRPAA